MDKKPKVDAKEEASSAQGNATVSKPSNSSEVNKHKVKRAILSTLLSRKKFYKILNHKLEAWASAFSEFISIACIILISRSVCYV